jgi:hypothetical protein
MSEAALTILVLICAASEPRCDAAHARAVRSFQAPPGVVICAAPVAFAGLAETAIRPGADEVMRIRCQGRRQ